MFLKEVSLFLDDAPLEEGDLATELPPIASGAMLTRCEGFAVVWRLLNGNKTLELRLVAVGHVSNTAEDMDMSDIATDYGALVDEVSRRLPVRFNFVAPIVPDVHFFEKEEAGIFIFCTQDGVVHEFRFPHELLFYSDLSDPSAWSKEHVLVSMKKESRSRHAVGFHALRSSMWVVACNDGALIHVDGENFQGEPKRLSRSYCSHFLRNVKQEHEMFPDSRKPLTRSLTTSLLWFGLGRGGESSQDNSNTQTTATTQVVSMASVICEPQQAQYLLTVSRDWKLRVWSLVDHRCVHVVSLDSNHRSNLDPTSPKYVAEVMSRRVRRLLRVFDCNLDDRGDSSQGYSFKAAIYCPFDESDVFVVYEAHLDSEGAWQKLDKVASINTPPSASAAQSVGEAQAVLADFDITPDSFAYPESSNEDGGGEETTGLTESGFWTVWTLWTREREMDLCYCKFGDEGRPSLHGVVGTSDMMSTIANIGDWTRILKTGTSWLESPDFNATEIGPRSVSEVFLQHIFYPNRFSPAAIVQALRTAERSGIIERSAGVSRAVMESMRSSEFPAGQLKNMLATAFETEGDDMSIPGGGTARDISDKAELCKLRWIKFLNACIQNQLLLNSPISLIIDSRYLHTIFVIKLGALATLRFCEELDILDQVYTGELEEPGDQDGTFSFLSQFPLSSYRDVLTPRTWDVFMVYLDALEILYNGIPAAVFSAVEEDVIVALRNMDSLPLASFVSNLVSRHGIGSAPTQVLGQLASGFLSKLSSCNNLQAFFGKMLSLLRDSSDFGVLGRRDSHEGASSSTSRPTTLSFQYTILALQQIAESRHRTCWNLAITLIMVSSLDQQEVVLPRSEVSALLADCLEVLRVWVILRWLCRETANAGSQPRSWNSALNRKHDLPGTLWNTDTDDDADATVSTKYQTLIATIMSQSKHGLPAHVLSDEAPLASYLLSWTWHFLAGEGFCQSPNGLYEANDGYALSVRKAFITCAVRLRHAGLDSALERFVRLLPIDHAGAYVNGLVLLDRDQPEQAADHFRNAGEAFSGDLRRTDTTLLPLLLPEDVFRAGAAGYFAHIMDLLSKRGHAQTSILFARMSLERLDTVDVSTSVRSRSLRGSDGGFPGQLHKGKESCRSTRCDLADDFPPVS